MTARTRYLVDVMLLVGAGLAFASGLVLLVTFHMGHGVFRAEALGLSRLSWQNLHRIGAVLSLAGVVAHVIANRRGIYVRLRRVLGGKALCHDHHETAVYVANLVVLLTGFVAWLAFSASVSLFGPVPFERLMGGRHAWIDVHHLTGLLALVLSINHVRRRWHALGKLGAVGARPRSRAHATRFIAVDTRRCQACWDCVQACPQHALGKVEVLWHRHVRVAHSDACSGCRKCLRACQHGALTAVPPPARPTQMAAT